MIKRDYSKPATLLRNERYDYDTRGHNPTGINENRALLPERYEVETWLTDGAEDFEWQITYSFPDKKRKYKFGKGVYGGKHVTFRRLYLILCEHFNVGGNKQYFIDEYFDSVYPYTIKERVDYFLSDIKGELFSIAEEYFANVRRTKLGTIDRRFNIDRRIRDYEREAEWWTENAGERVSELIKDDIISSLANGVIPLNYRTSAKMLAKRQSLGLDAEQTFYASRQLIESIQLYIDIGGSSNIWQTAIQGIMA